jgi:hypothetical protein
MLARTGNEPRPSMTVGRTAQLVLNSEDWTHITIIAGLAAVSRNVDVASVQQGAWHERWCSNVSSVTWRFVWTEIILRIIIQRTTYKTSFRPSFVQTVEASTTA